MLDFHTAVITEKGLALNTKANAGKSAILFTKLKLGSGAHEPEEDLSKLTGLKDPKQEFPFEKKEIKDHMTVMLRCTMSNEALQESYRIDEIGIFAQDPEEGEILYSIATAAGEADTMPAFQGENLVTITLDSYVTVSSTANVQINIQPGDWVTHEEMESAHEALEEKLRQELSGASEEELDEAKRELQAQIAAKADKSSVLSATISKDGWTGEEAPYTVTVTVEGLTGAPEELVEVYVPATATTAQKLAWMEAGILTGENLEGSLKLEALGEKPTEDIPISILKRGDLGDGSSGGGGTTACACTPIPEEQIEAIFE